MSNLLELVMKRLAVFLIMTSLVSCVVGEPSAARSPLFIGLLGDWNPMRLLKADTSGSAIEWGVKKIGDKRYRSSGNDVYFEAKGDVAILGGGGGYVLVDRIVQAGRELKASVHYLEASSKKKMSGVIFITEYDDGSISFRYDMPQYWPDIFWEDSGERYVRAESAP